MQDRNRRWFLKAAGATVVAGTLAGCIGDDDDDEIGPDDWEGITEITLEGYADRWEGMEPSFIDGVANPTLYLTEGEEYTIEWVNGDGVDHNLQIENDAGDVLYETEFVSGVGNGDTLTFTATAEMTTYICDVHRAQQVGDIEIV